MAGKVWLLPRGDLSTVLSLCSFPGAALTAPTGWLKQQKSPGSRPCRPQTPARGVGGALLPVTALEEALLRPPSSVLGARDLWPQVCPPPQARAWVPVSPSYQDARATGSGRFLIKSSL